MEPIRETLAKTRVAGALDVVGLTRCDPYMAELIWLDRTLTEQFYRFYEQLKNMALGKAAPQTSRRQAEDKSQRSRRQREGRRLMDRMPSTDPYALLQSLSEREAPMISSGVEAKARIRFTVAQALMQGRVGFHYQPVVRAADPKAPAFFEMLARLTLPDGRILPAAGFLPAVEDGALGRAIDRLALTQALRVLARQPELRLAVNMSPLSMGDEEWLSILTAAARGGGGACGRLILEVTEDAALQNAEQTVDFMDYVRGSGCAFALDDFGAGATGFRHFREFRFDMVKIDGAFVQGAHRSPDAKVLVECLMAVSRHFEMMTVAERVESSDDADWLRDLGVDCLQGYLYGKPTAVAEMPARPDPARAGPGRAVG